MSYCVCVFILYLLLVLGAESEQVLPVLSWCVCVCVCVTGLICLKIFPCTIGKYAGYVFIQELAMRCEAYVQ